MTLPDVHAQCCPSTPFISGTIRTSPILENLPTAFLSTPRTTHSLPRTPTTAEPLFTASIAYSTWNKCPSGEKMVIARSYDMMYPSQDPSFENRDVRDSSFFRWTDFAFLVWGNNSVQSVCSA